MISSSRISSIFFESSGLRFNFWTKFESLFAELDEFKGRWAATQALAPERLAALRQVAGYAELMEMIFTSFKDIPFTENHIKQLHSVLLKYSTKDDRHRGDYKKFANSVEAFGPDSKSKGVIFHTATPFDTPALMTELIDWTNTQIKRKELHPLLMIAVFVVVFLHIHPFQDGNGRLSRALTTLLLLQLGYSYVPYSTFERIIEESKDSYYLALRRGQAELEERPWQPLVPIEIPSNCISETWWLMDTLKKKALAAE